MQKEVQKVVQDVLPKLGPLVAQHLFSNSSYISGPYGDKFNIRLVAQGLCKSVEIVGYLFITQNPNKQSKWAVLSRKGHKIVWVIRKSDNKWTGRVMDGVYESL